MANPTTLYTGSDGRITVDVTEAKSLVAADAGIVQNVTTDGITVTLPTSAAATVGATFIIRNGGVAASSAVGSGTGADASCLVTVAPGASDGISGLAFTAATNKAALNTKATSKVGDEIQLVGSGVTSAAAWFVQRVKGTWARAA
jgi:ethanolamine ammonia-lyase small subunit